MYISQQTLIQLQDELYQALVVHAKGKIEKDKLRTLSQRTLTLKTIQNPYFSHKSIQWYAKTIIESIKM